MIEEIYLQGRVGSNFVQHPILSFVTIITVAKGGKIHEQVDSTPENLEFEYVSGGGSVFFGSNFEDIGDGFTETVLIKYKE